MPRWSSICCLRRAREGVRTWPRLGAGSDSDVRHRRGSLPGADPAWSDAPMGVTEVNRAIEAVWRIESGRVIAALAALVRDVGWAEELAQDALVAALEQWPRGGVPANPGAWLTAVGKRRAIDGIRRRQVQDRKV